MEIIRVNVWGKEFPLEIVFDCYKNEVVTEPQKKALAVFLEHPEWIASSKQDVVSFCKKRVFDFWGKHISDEVFDYIVPKEIYIKRDDDNHRVALMCDFKYDPEQGVAVVFSGDGKVTVGIQNII